MSSKGKFCTGTDVALFYFPPTPVFLTKIEIFCENTPTFTNITRLCLFLTCKLIEEKLIEEKYWEHECTLSVLLSKEVHILTHMCTRTEHMDNVVAIYKNKSICT